MLFLEVFALFFQAMLFGDMIATLRRVDWVNI